MNTEARTYNTASNLMMSLINKTISIILTFIGRQIFLQVLSIEYLGINGLFSDIISILSVADLGLGLAMAYSFYKPLAEKDGNKISALIGFYKRIYNYIAAIVAVIGIALTPFLKYIINSETEIPYTEVYYLITLSQTVISYLFVYKSTIITADQRSRVVTKYSMWISVVVLVVQVVTLFTVKNYMVYCIIPVFGTLLNNILLSRKADKLYPFIKKKVPLAKAEKRDIFRNISSVVVYKIATVLYSSTDSMLISMILGTAIVGKYANYKLSVTNLSAIVTMIFSALTPSLGNLIVKGKPENRLQVFKIMQTASCWLSGFFIFCLFFLLDEFVSLWLGSEYLFDMSTKLAILVNFYLVILLYPIIAFREATGIYQKTKYVMLGGAALNLVISIIWGRSWGLPGILLATCVSKLLTYAWYEPKILFRDYLGGGMSDYICSHLLNILMLTACIAFVHFVLPYKVSVGWLGWVVQGMVYTLGINAVYFLRYYRTPEFKNILSKISVLKKKIQKPQ